MKTTKTKRASVACNTCRESKLKCLNNCDLSSCQRCTSLNIKCTYTLKTSQLKKKKLINNHHFIKPIIQNQSVLLPDKTLIIEVVTIFFENQYKGIFPLFHKPSFLTFLRSDSFNPETFIDHPPNTSLLQPDPVVLLAILALCARLHPELPKIYGEFNESTATSFQPIFTNVLNLNSASNASNYFGWHARKLIGENFDNPSLNRVQALCILSSHEWGEGNALRSHMYSGLAVRMAMLLGLDKENEEIEELFLEKEVKRRAMWSAYMMDRCNASGRRCKSCISITDVKLKLPCDEKNFIFGASNKEQLFRNDLEISINNGLIKDVSCCGFMIYLFEVWRNISVWVGETGGKLERIAPWDEKSPFDKLSKQLDKFEDCLPSNLKFNEFNISAHIADGSAADFAYFHGLYFLCRIFLNREYFYSSPDAFPNGWWKQLAIQLFETLDNLNSITQTLKPMNLMVIAPFTGFQVFTTASTSLYIAAYPSKVLDQQFSYDVTKKYSKMAEYCLETLKSWSKSWGLGKNWIETLLKLKTTFREISDYHQDDELRHKMHDYGNIDQQSTKDSMQISNLITEENNSESTLDFMKNLDLANIFPDWTIAMTS
ncbi:uncharacterized protein KGF55_000109 [Candida pseudojiufengensis]|uniref:uncharacterized protein n=1 Tax=Candida pseudojiufengensis TaxID=497109 RepID=UPI002224AF02|nr:uncharacterized protein KGF55_000109 [Candida pseudojiufengensis]KAI5966700.1 hypothetical protein KGF55_000109 [Candida pseudojiufengensis]